MGVRWHILLPLRVSSNTLAYRKTGWWRSKRLRVGIKTLAQSNVRAAYGVNVVAIVREADVNINPNPADVIRSGDLLFVLGTVNPFAPSKR